MKYKTVRDGQQAVIYNHLGEGTLVVGPERVFLFRKRLHYLSHYTASPEQYLVIEDLDGFVHHKTGPCTMFCNPLEVRSIDTEDAIKLSANQMIVVYKKQKDNSVVRRIVKGPMVFVPQAEEWLHNFEWHGEDPHTQGHMVPKQQIFTKLVAVPDQFSYNVREVRTNDDTMLTVKLMIFYELQDVITMLEATHDPVADMINAVCADIISFAGKISFTEFLLNTGPLSTLHSYPQLLQRAERIGYAINNVVYRGYHASNQLQAMQDNAIQSRTQMRIDAELHEQKQKLADYKLQCEHQRIQLSHDMEKNKVDHCQQVDCLQQVHQLELKQLQERTTNQMEDLMTRTKLEISAAANEEQQEYLKQLRNCEVDLTKYLTNQQEPAPNEEIHIV